MLGWVGQPESQVALFTGRADITIDSKQRLAIASKFRAQLENPPAQDAAPRADQPETAVVWYAVPWPDGPHIRLIPEPTFHSLANEQAASLTSTADEARVRTTLFSLAERLEMDKAGRVRLPKHLMDLTEMPDSGEVVVLGVNQWLEVRDRAAWTDVMPQLFKTLPEMIDRTKHAGRG